MLASQIAMAGGDCQAGSVRAWRVSFVPLQFNGLPLGWPCSDLRLRLLHGAEEQVGRRRLDTDPLELRGVLAAMVRGWIELALDDSP
jgi:hypothetical protein